MGVEFGLWVLGLMYIMALCYDCMAREGGFERGGGGS